MKGKYIFKLYTNIIMNDYVTESMIKCLRNNVNINESDEVIIQCQDLSNIGFDSIELMYVILKFEEVFEISFKEEDLTYDNVIKFMKLHDLICTYIKEKTE